jgi:hypothetical protein
MAKSRCHCRHPMQPSKSRNFRPSTSLTRATQTRILGHVLAYDHASYRWFDDFRRTEQDKYRSDVDHAPLEHGWFEASNGPFGFYGRVVLCQYVD